MGKSLALLTCWLGLTISLWAGGARYGMSRDEVETALGKPAAALTRGPRLILLYPANGRVELEGGAVVRLTNVPVDDGTPALRQPAATTTTLSKKDIAQADAEAKAEKMRQQDQRALEAATEKLADSHGRMLPLIVGPNPHQFWSSLVVGLVFRTLVTVVVLKLAFKWSDVHADWGQMFLPALADTATQAGVSAAAFALWKTNQLFYLDVGVSYLVLLGVLMKTTHACTLQRAVAVAGAAKFVSFVLWALISAMLLSLLF